MGGLTPVSPAQLAPSAIKTTFLGEFAESEIRNLVKRSFNLDKEEAYLIDFIVASPKTDYQASSEFVRHACFLLLQTYYRDGILEQDYEGGTGLSATWQGCEGRPAGPGLGPNSRMTCTSLTTKWRAHVRQGIQATCSHISGCGRL
jgi:hypothetical protein